MEEAFIPCCGVIFPEMGLIMYISCPIDMDILQTQQAVSNFNAAHHIVLVFRLNTREHITKKCVAGCRPTCSP